VRRLLATLGLLLTLWIMGNASSAYSGSTAKSVLRSGFPQTVRVRLWYLHPPHDLHLRADAGQALLRWPCMLLVRPSRLRATNPLQLSFASPARIR
jgi:hypothetical protein